ncbi:MAG: hypothetical protein ACRCTY_01065, partial [Candidatus Adiutrix sp.]
LLIMDIRRDPQEEEYDLLKWLVGLNIEPWLIASKADKLKSGERANRLLRIKNLCAAKLTLTRPPLAFSALSGLGRNTLISDIVDSDLLNTHDLLI